MQLWNNGQPLAAYNEEIQFADFTGDGKTDIMVKNLSGQYKIYSFKQFNQAPWTDVVLVGQGANEDAGFEKTILYGDFNGDGKTDFVTPTGTTYIENSTVWSVYYSNPKPNGGSFFEREVLNIPGFNYWPNSGGFFTLGTQFNSYYAIDTNKDGKTDLVKIWRNHFKPECTINDHDTNWNITSFANNIGKGGSTTNGFVADYASPPTSRYISHFPCAGYNDPNHSDDSPEMITPIVSTFSHNGLNNEIIVIRKNSNLITYINFFKDFNKDNNLIEVRQSGGLLNDVFKYKALDSNPNVNNGLNAPTDFYSSTNTLEYPYVELKQLATTRLVEKHTNTVDNVVRNQDFFYHGYTTKFDGIGVLGFKKTARSSWYNENTGDKIWTVSENNPFQRGATIKTYTQLLPANVPFSFNNQSNKLNQTDNVFEQNIPSTKYILLLKKQTNTDFISNIVKTTETQYTNDYFYLEKP